MVFTLVFVATLKITQLSFCLFKKICRTKNTAVPKIIPQIFGRISKITDLDFYNILLF